MNTNPETRSLGPTSNAEVRLMEQTDLRAMDRDALLGLTESLFRWALRHTGLTRQQILAQIARDDGLR